MSVYIQFGKILLDSGKVATNNDCCCGGGACSDNFVTLVKCGFPEYEGFVSSPPKKYLDLVQVNICNTGTPDLQCTATSSWDPDTCGTPGGTCTNNSGFGCDTGCFPELCPFNHCNPLLPTSGTHAECGGPAPAFETHRTEDLSNEYTTAMLIDNTLARYFDTFGDCPEGCVLTYILNEDETSCTAFCIPE